MEIWHLCLVLSILFLALGVFWPRLQPTTSEKPQVLVQGEQLAMPADTPVLLPEIWDEAAITKQLTVIQDRSPSVINYYINSLRQRFVERQNERTALERTTFLRAKLEQLKAAKDCQQTLYDLQLSQHEYELKVVKLTTEKSDMEELALLRRDKEKLQIEVEMARLRKEMEDLKNPVRPDVGKPEVPLTPEQKKAQERQTCETRIDALKSQKEAVQQLKDDEERVRKLNAIDDALQREYDRWARLI